jgi:hypothetical protein
MIEVKIDGLRGQSLRISGCHMFCLISIGKIMNVLLLKYPSLWLTVLDKHIYGRVGCLFGWVGCIFGNGLLTQFEKTPGRSGKTNVGCGPGWISVLGFRNSMVVMSPVFAKNKLTAHP